MAFTFCTSEAIVVKAGAGANATAIASAAILANFSGYAEATILGVSRHDWVTNYSTAGANAKLILGDIASSLAAIPLITYDMSGYTSRIEAEDMINVQRDIALRGLSIIRDQKAVDFIK